MTIFFASDTHFGHKAILKYCNRPFASVEEMDEKLVANWNSVVKPQDSVYHLGDFGWGGVEKVAAIFARLNGQKFLVKGNHDDKAVTRLAWGFVKESYELRSGDKTYILSHYPHRSWDKSFHGARHLFGHCHGTLKPWGWSFDAGVDCWDYTPISIEQVEEVIAKLPRMNPEYDVSFMQKGQIWNGRTFDYSYRDFFVGDGSADNVDPESIKEE